MSVPFLQSACRDWGTGHLPCLLEAVRRPETLRPKDTLASEDGFAHRAPQAPLQSGHHETCTSTHAAGGLLKVASCMWTSACNHEANHANGVNWPQLGKVREQTLCSWQEDRSKLAQCVRGVLTNLRKMPPGAPGEGSGCRVMQSDCRPSAEDWGPSCYGHVQCLCSLFSLCSLCMC